MAKADLCPVCYGEGKRPGEEIPCHGCGGWGWVEVSEDIVCPYYSPCPLNPYPLFPYSINLTIY